MANTRPTVASVEERLLQLEQTSHAKFVEIDSKLGHMDSSIIKLESAIDQKFVEIGEQFEGINVRFGGMDTQFAELKAQNNRIMQLMETRLGSEK